MVQVCWSLCIYAKFAEALSEDQLQVIKELFVVFDENHDGCLDKKGMQIWIMRSTELRGLMRELQVFLADEELDDLFKHLDINKDGKVQSDEFVKGLKWIQKVALLNPIKQKAIQLGKHEEKSAKEKPKLQKSKSFFNVCFL